MDAFKNPEQIEFADLFAELERHGLRASDVARELKMSPSAVSMTLKGKRSPRPLTLEAMRKFVASIAGGKSTDVAALKESSSAYLTEHERELAKLLPKERKEVIALVGEVISYAVKKSRRKKP